MIVSISKDEVVTLLEPGEFKRLQVSAPEAVDVDHALQGSRAGRWETETGSARVSVDWLRNSVKAALRDQAWIKDLDGMLEYASSKGWLHDDGTIAAHVERST